MWSKRPSPDCLYTNKTIGSYFYVKYNERFVKPSPQLKCRRLTRETCIGNDRSENLSYHYGNYGWQRSQIPFMTVTTDGGYLCSSSNIFRSHKIFEDLNHDKENRSS